MSEYIVVSRDAMDNFNKIVITVEAFLQEVSDKIEGENNKKTVEQMAQHMNQLSDLIMRAIKKGGMPQITTLDKLFEEYEREINGRIT